MKNMRINDRRENKINKQPDRYTTDEVGLIFLLKK